MAPFMSSTFTTGERRKKVVTYGKLSRVPPPRSSIPDDAPSPERPRKHTAISSGPTAEVGGPLDTTRALATARATTTSPDVFDVPSEDELESQSTKPTNRPAPLQRSKTEAESRATIAKPHEFAPGRAVATASRPPKQPGGLKPAATTNKTLQGQIGLQQPARLSAPLLKPPSTGPTSQTKAPPSSEGQKQAATSGRRLQRSNTSSKNVSRTTTPEFPAQSSVKSQSVAKTNPAVPSSKATKLSTKQSASLDVFEVPSDEEQASLPILEPPMQIARQALKDKPKELAAAKVASLNAPQNIAVKSHKLGILQNRKRKGSISSITAPKSVVARIQEPVMAQRDRKVTRREKGTSPGHGSTRPSIPRSALPAATAEASINKPRRTRTRTVPVVSQPTVSKGHSSPAMLHSMVPVARASKAPLDDVTSELLASDDTMYDIPDPMTTPVRPTPLRGSTTSTPGSVTPRQKDLFSTLLGGSAAPKTPASALASLQLTDKKPRSLLGALARSKSDLPYSSQSRKTRLIDTLRDETSSEEDDSESDGEADATIAADSTPKAKPATTEPSTHDVDMDRATPADSQTSQMTSGAVTRPRLTYAAQRSYLQEANPEDEFLISMDLDDSWNVDSQTVSTDDEDGPTSQVRTHHELKKYGQNTMFSWDMEESIREISDESSKSARRSALMDLCTKMVDAGFVSQLLDSGFMHKLLEIMRSTDDVIFNFLATASVLFVLQTKPAFAVVDQIYRSGITSTLIKVVDNDIDISRIARDRKSNMSKIAQESLVDFRALVLAAKAWSPNTPEKASPQILTLKTIDLLVRNLRESGSIEALLSPVEVSKIVKVFPTPSSRIKTTKATSQDILTVDLALSILETVSIAEQDYSTWPTKTLQHLAEVLPIFFEDNGPSKTVEAMKLCMNLTNNKPKACQPFSDQAFIQPLIHFIVGRFDVLHSGELDADRRTQVLAALTLGLGAMINLAELSDQARRNTIDDRNSIEVLVKTFVAGSERAAEANSVEESEFSVQVGFLTVLLGNLCLNNTVRSKVRASLPGQQLQPLLEQMKEFARIHEHVDKRTASRFEGPEGKEALNNYYLRIMHVVRKLEGARE
ncbi:uncharacterized protein EKO05_0003121 [Ascochyta rabiei]|uniref:uncharacterized protein n=1 Tax=Didymella rabiei TaxID=5454 RepID=UPI002204C9FC|nr:uncharacterized protein EKO05_0003121 [Ascochyta rabiei]UPX12577.1 hypothetical protein EKO05_0003121 [Ascochyta rabiei]